MKFGVYFVYTKSAIGPSPIDLIRSINKKDITICVPNWLEHEKLLNEFSDIQYLNSDEFYKLDNFFIFADENVFCSPIIKDKNVCFVIERLDEDLSNIIEHNFKAIEKIKTECAGGNFSILSLYHKEIKPPFDKLFTAPKAKYRNCFIINDSLVGMLDQFDFNKDSDFAIPYAARMQQKMTYEKINETLLSPTDSKASFSQALMADNIYIEPDIYDLFIVSVALKELIYTNKKYKSHNPTLKRLELFNSP